MGNLVIHNILRIMFPLIRLLLPLLFLADSNWVAHAKNLTHFRWPVLLHTVKVKVKFLIVVIILLSSLHMR